MRRSSKYDSNRAKRSSTGPTHKPRIISEDFVQGVRHALNEIEKLHLEEREHVFANSMRMMITYRCMAEFTMEYAPKECLGRILRDTERVANRIGASIHPDKVESTSCLAERHEECSGSYIKLVGGGKIICRCGCHRPAV